MSSLAISFPSGGPAPVNSGTLTYCCGTYTLSDVPSGTSVEILGKIYIGAPTDRDPPPGASPADVALDTWNYPGGLAGASDSASGQAVRMWLVLDGVTADYDDQYFDPCVEGTSGCPTPTICTDEALGIAAVTELACVIDSIAPRVFELQMDVASLDREPVYSLLAGGMLQANSLALTYNADRSNWDAEVWSSKSGRVRMRVVRSACGKQLHAEVVLMRTSPRGIRAPLRWVCRQFSLLNGGAFTLASVPSGTQLGDISVRPCP